MNIKEKRVKQFQYLQELVNDGLYHDLNWSQAKVITPASLGSIYPVSNAGDISFAQENVITSIKNSEKAMVLIFASAKNPGGGVLHGSIAQEEEIALHSSWYFQAKDATDFYLPKGADAINSDNLLYVEKGYLLQDENGNDIDPVEISFIAGACPNLNGMNNQGKKVDESLMQNIMAARIESVLKLAQQHQCQQLILGAWCCGVFGWEPAIVASIFKEKIIAGWYGGNIKFSIIDAPTLEIFTQTFREKTILCKKKKP